MVGPFEVSDLTLGDQLLDGAGDVLAGHVRVDAMLVQQVDAIGPEPSQLALEQPARAHPRGRRGRSGRQARAEGDKVA